MMLCCQHYVLIFCKFVLFQNFPVMFYLSSHDFLYILWTMLIHIPQNRLFSSSEEACVNSQKQKTTFMLLFEMIWDRNSVHYRSQQLFTITQYLVIFHVFMKFWLLLFLYLCFGIMPGDRKDRKRTL